MTAFPTRCAAGLVNWIGSSQLREFLPAKPALSPGPAAGAAASGRSIGLTPGRSKSTVGVYPLMALRQPHRGALAGSSVSREESTTILGLGELTKNYLYVQI